LAFILRTPFLYLAYGFIFLSYDETCDKFINCIRQLYIMKPRVYKGGRPGHNTFYLLIPKDVADSLGIKPDDDFILNVGQKNDELILSYRRIRK